LPDNFFLDGDWGWLWPPWLHLYARDSFCSCVLLHCRVTKESKMKCIC